MNAADRLAPFRNCCFIYTDIIVTSRLSDQFKYISIMFYCEENMFMNKIHGKTELGGAKRSYVSVITGSEYISV